MASTHQTQIGITLYVFSCPRCDMLVAVDSNFDERRRQDGETFYCPNGHSISYRDSEYARLKRERDAAQRAADTWRNAAAEEQVRRTRAEGSLRATKGVVTRIKNRVGRGVCPVCNRSFQNLKDHMEGQHPGWHDGDG